ncbi:MAG: hypothetical protein H0X39_20085, partial [Actinobacteria bacterium]|nr:hypothetical protein [Actinomycetota bacterium]
LYRVRIEIDRADDRELAFRVVRNLLDEAGDSPERQDAWRYANDKLGMTVQLRAGRASARSAAAPSQRVLDASARLERNALAGALAHAQLRDVLAELTPEHFYDPAHRRLRAHIVDGTELDDEGRGLLAELDARAESEGIDANTGTELLLRLRERELRKQLQHSEPGRTRELQEALGRLLEKVAALSSA